MKSSTLLLLAAAGVAYLALKRRKGASVNLGEQSHTNPCRGLNTQLSRAMPSTAWNLTWHSTPAISRLMHSRYIYNYDTGQCELKYIPRFQTGLGGLGNGDSCEAKCRALGFKLQALVSKYPLLPKVDVSQTDFNNAMAFAKEALNLLQQLQSISPADKCDKSLENEIKRLLTPLVIANFQAHIEKTGHEGNVNPFEGESGVTASNSNMDELYNKSARLWAVLRWKINEETKKAAKCAVDEVNKKINEWAKTHKLPKWLYGAGQSTPHQVEPIQPSSPSDAPKGKTPDASYGPCPGRSTYGPDERCLNTRSPDYGQCGNTQYAPNFCSPSGLGELEIGEAVVLHKI